MSSRLDFYFRQRVTEAELDLAFTLLEKADRDLAADIGIYGVVAGAVPAPHAPVPDLTVDLTAPARAYDHLGQRLFFGTDQTVDCAVDLAGLPTDVALAGNERWVGIFLRFGRLLSDPRTDGNAQQVFFRRDESFELVVRQAPEGAVGLAPRPALQPDELLLCDIRRRPGQAQIFAADIDTSRRQAFVFAQGSFVAVATGAWNILAPLAGTAQAAFDEVDAELRDHFTGAARRHPAAAIDYAPHAFVGATNVQGAINELVDDLGSSAAGASGASRVGADAAPGAPFALAPGNVDGQLASLLGFLNAHLSAASGAHSASAVNVVDAGGNLNATNVEAALAEAIDAFEGDHFRANEASGGQHRTVRQPVLPGTKALLWDAQGVGAQGMRFRVYLDATSVWFTLNAAWNGAAWARDEGNLLSSGFRFSRGDFEFLQEHTFAATFPAWSRTWRLPMTAGGTGFEMTGPVLEVGRLGLAWTNADAVVRNLSAGGSVTFRNRFPGQPSSITLSPLSQSAAFVGNPSVFVPDRDGFAFVSSQSVAGLGFIFWLGTYSALA